MLEKVTTFNTDDGRVLQIAEAGRRDGIPVVMHGGTPGSYVFLSGMVQEAEKHGLRLIGYNRPGYGESTSLPGRSVASAAEDVIAIANHLQLDRLATVGASGGGPHAIACAAMAPKLVAAAVSMESPAPFDARGLDWFAGMDESTTAEFKAASESREAITKFVSEVAAGIMSTTLEDMVAGFLSATAETDKITIEAVARWFFETSRVALGRGNDGWIDDNLAFCAPWGFDLARIQVPVLIMHGLKDTMVPPAHGRWLAGRVAGAEAQYFDNDDHGTLFGRRFPEARAWIAAKMRS